MMDIQQAKTFLAVVGTGSFVDAAEQLYVTQSTVSTRIKSLEDQLGQILFTRGRGGAVPTAAGQQFFRHASAFVRIWDHARQEVGLPETFSTLLKVGGQAIFWNDFLLDWACWMRKFEPGIALRTEFGTSENLLGMLAGGLLDFAVMYSSQNRRGLSVEKLFDDHIVAVTSNPEKSEIGGRDYIYEDWGESFGISHAEAFPGIEAPGLSDGIGSVGMNIMLKQGGTGYFPIRLITEHLEAGRLYTVAGAPRFTRPVYVVYTEEPGTDDLNVALDGLRRIALKAGKSRIRSGKTAA